jgi:hypothetical protein
MPPVITIGMHLPRTHANFVGGAVATVTIQLGPERAAIDRRRRDGNRAKAGDVPMAHAAGIAVRLGKAHMQAVRGLAEADEHEAFSPRGHPS